MKSVHRLAGIYQCQRSEATNSRDSAFFLSECLPVCRASQFLSSLSLLSSQRFNHKHSASHKHIPLPFLHWCLKNELNCELTLKQSWIAEMSGCFLSVPKYWLVQQLQVVSVRIKLCPRKGGKNQKPVVYNKESIMLSIERNRYTLSFSKFVYMKMAFSVIIHQISRRREVSDHRHCTLCKENRRQDLQNLKVSNIRCLIKHY